MWRPPRRRFARTARRRGRSPPAGGRPRRPWRRWRGAGGGPPPSGGEPRPRRRPAGRGPALVASPARGATGAGRIRKASCVIPEQRARLPLSKQKWIQGEQGPGARTPASRGQKITAAGHPVVWRRDPLENYAFEVMVPDGANAVDLALDFLLPSDQSGFSFAASSSANLAVISWNTVLLYPKGPAANAINFATHVQLPQGWKYAT